MMKNNLRKLILIQLLLLISLSLFAQDYFTQLRDSGKWVLKEYFDILYEKDKEKLLECFPAVEENYIQVNYLS